MRTIFFLFFVTVNCFAQFGSTIGVPLGFGSSLGSLGFSAIQASDPTLALGTPLGNYVFNTGLFQDAAKTTASTDSVGCWADQSGNGKDLKQTTAGKKPTNSSGAVSYPSTGDIFLLSASFATAQPYTISFVAKWNAATTVDFQAIWDSGNRALFRRTGSGSEAGAYAGITTVTYTPTTTAYKVYTVIYDGANSLIYENNTLKASGTNIGTASLTSFTLGSSSGGGGGLMNGVIKAGRVYGKVLSVAEIAILVTYWTALL